MKSSKKEILILKIKRRKKNIARKSKKFIYNLTKTGGTKGYKKETNEITKEKQKKRNKSKKILGNKEK